MCDRKVTGMKEFEETCRSNDPSAVP